MLNTCYANNTYLERKKKKLPRGMPSVPVFMLNVDFMVVTPTTFATVDESRVRLLPKR